MFRLVKPQLVLLLTFVLPLAVACSSAAPRPAPTSTSAESTSAESTSAEIESAVEALADEYVDAYFEAFPYQALTSGAPDLRPTELVDHTLEGLERWHAREDALLARLEAVDIEALPEDSAARVTHGFLDNQLRSARAHRVCHIELWNVSPTWTGWISELAGVAAQVPVANAEQRAAALARFGAIPRYLDAEIENLETGLDLGYSAPATNVAAVLEQVEALLAADVGDSPFVQIAARVEDDGEAAAFRRVLETLETGSLRPAIARYRDFLRDEVAPRAREAVGVSANPDGEACYRAALAYYTTTEITPREVHELGLAQMTAIQDELRTLGARSFGVDDPRELLARMKSDPRYRFDDREQLVATAVDAVDRARLALPRWFGRLPAAEVVVEPYPAYQEKSAPGGFYTPPTADGSRPGVYKINAYQAAEQSRAGLEATAFHETYPGHHLQGSIALERDGLHPVSQYFYLSGFGEGWALYSERLAQEMGLYSGDVDRVGLLSNEALRAARLVVDSGMHALGWSRQRAIDYLLANTASTRAQATAEIDRYIAVPGQATSYMVGSLEIRALRDEAEAALGEAFDVRAFHDLVLEDGSVPLWMLRDKVERWIAARQVARE